MIMKRDCKHSFQDSRYGIGMRIYNLAGKKGEKARCTVCLREKILFAADKTKQKKQP